MNIKSISEAATQLFTYARTLMGDEPSMSIHSEGQHPIQICRLGGFIELPIGQGQTYSIAQYIPKGEPPTLLVECCFIIIDHPWNPARTTYPRIYPYFYRNRAGDIKAYSITQKEGIYYAHTTLQLEQARLTDKWIRELKAKNLLP